MTRSKSRRSIFLSCLLILACRLTGLYATETNSDVTFEKDVRPILKAHCFHCHGEDGVKEGELDLRLRHFMVAGGETGSAVEPGKPVESLLLSRIASGEMPPDGKALPENEIAIIREWIKQGARTARKEPATLSDVHLTEEEKSFWAFQPIDRPNLPEVKSPALIQTPVDAFVLASLEKMQLEFSPEASKTTLIRRLSFDLEGLPPTPQAVAEFLKDSSPSAVESLIDRLLNSPAYGERWGRHWLDVAGYADSEGYTDRDPEREFAFFYRDYVVNSFNEGKPFDRFIIEQLAGDELIESPLDRLKRQDQELLMATGFLRMAADGTASGGVDRAVASNENISDTIQIVSTSLLGLTVGCARCHNHRYDPISQVDYYRLRAVFEPALDWKAWKTPQQRQVSLYTESEKELRKQIEGKANAVEEERKKKQASHLERTLYEELLKSPDDKRNELRLAYQTEKSKRSKEQADLLEEYPNIQNISAGSLYLYSEQRVRRANEILQEGNRRAGVFVEQIQRRELKKVTANDLTVVQAMLKVKPEKWTKDQQELAKRYPAVFVAENTLEKFDPEAAKVVSRYREAAKVCRSTDAKKELADLSAKAAEIRATAPREFFIRALIEPGNHLPETFLFKRGSHSQPAQKVQPGELEVVALTSRADISNNDPKLDSSGRRLAYARHLTNGRHPLVARVLVNRIWMHHFGKGLVETTGDFGLLGAPPSHPELLDWLASELMESGWNVKYVQRLILMSKTYQQQSRRTEKLDEIDPSNTWLGRQTIKRLESEAIRDAILQVSGNMIRVMGGPPIPVKEDAVGQIVLGKQKLDGERKPQPGNKLGGDAERRSIYIQVRRSRPLAVLESFDIATKSPNCAKRHFSNVAPQSLMLMNSDFIIRYSEIMATRLEKEESVLGNQIRKAFQLCFAQQPNEQEVKSFEDFVIRQKDAFKKTNPKFSEEQLMKKGLANLCHAFLSSNKFYYID